MQSVQLRFVTVLGALLAASLAAPATLCAKTKLDWDPEHTWVFAAGILEWEHSDIYASFPAAMKNRRDAQVVKYFKDAGVPAKQITYLQDAAASKERIQHDFRALLDRTSKGDLLIFYFAGHGSRDADTGETWFANYDAGNANSSAWNTRSIF